MTLPTFGIMGASLVTAEVGREVRAPFVTAVVSAA